MSNVDSGNSFADRYGPWAVITGGSEGVGAAWASALVDRGVGVVLVARRPEPLDNTAKALRERGGDVRTISLDVTVPDVVDRLRSVTDDIEIGSLILNAGAMRTREYTWFLDEDLETIETVVTLNTLVTVRLVHRYGRPMRERGSGAIVVIGSLSGMAGQPFEAAYSGAKSFGQVFAEAMWCELRDHGVDVVSVPLGGTRTEGLEQSTMNIDIAALPTAQEIVHEAIEHLADGPVFVPNEKNRSFFDKVTRSTRRDAAETMTRLAYRVRPKPNTPAA
jgi:short-subunit dehydrogenase